MTVSDVDRKELLALRDGLDIDVVPNGVDARNIRPLPREGRGMNILFVGSMDYVPNVDGILHLARHIFPLVLARLPDCKLTIVGRAPPPAVLALAATPGVSVHPDVKEVLPFYTDALAAGVYLRSGGGTRLKILEALATGTPVVSTTVGCEGIDVRHGHDILVADRPADFADRLVEVMIDPALWSRLSANGIALAAERYDWGILARQLRASYLRALKPR